MKHNWDKDFFYAEGLDATYRMELCLDCGLLRVFTDENVETFKPNLGTCKKVRKPKKTKDETLA